MSNGSATQKKKTAGPVIPETLRRLCQWLQQRGVYQISAEFGSDTDGGSVDGSSMQFYLTPAYADFHRTGNGFLSSYASPASVHRRSTFIGGESALAELHQEMFEVPVDNPQEIFAATTLNWDEDERIEWLDKKIKTKTATAYDLCFGACLETLDINYPDWDVSVADHRVYGHLYIYPDGKLVPQNNLIQRTEQTLELYYECVSEYSDDDGDDDDDDY